MTQGEYPSGMELPRLRRRRVAAAVWRASATATAWLVSRVRMFRSIRSIRVVRPATAAALAAVVLTAAGCGGWDGPSATPPETGGTAGPSGGPLGSAPLLPASPFPSTAEPKSRRELRAADFLLMPGPETAGFRVEDSDQSDYKDFPEQDFADCLGVPVELVQDRSMQIAIGPRIFDELTGFSLSSTAAVVSEEVLTRDLQVIKRPQYPGCAAEFARDIFLQRLISDRGEGAGLSIKIEKAEAVPAPAGASTRWTLVMAVSDTTGILFKIYYDVIRVFEGRVEATIYVHGPDPLDEGVIAAATAQVVDKVDNQ